MDDIAARLPERLAGPDDALRLALEFEDELAFEQVTEDRAGVAVRR